MENEAEININAIPSQELRQRAWGILTSNKKRAVLFTLFYIAAIIFTSILLDEGTWGFEAESMSLSGYIIAVSVFYIAWYLVFTPIPVGFAKFFLQMSNGVQEKFSVITFGFKKYIRNTVAIMLADLIYYGLFAASIVLIAVVASLFFTANYGIKSLGINSEVLESGLISFAVVIAVSLGLVIICFIFYKTFALLEFLQFLLAENSDMGAIKLIKVFWRKTSPYNLKMIKLWCSFIGWWLLCLVTLGLASLWVIPYWMLAKAELYKEIFRENP